MKLFLAIILSAGSLISYAQQTPLKDLIRDPLVSRRCKALLKERDKKIKVQQRLNAMLTRNEKLQTMLNDKQKITMKRLKLNRIQLKNNFRLTKMKVQSMNENIVRKGCPGITL